MELKKDTIEILRQCNNCKKINFKSGFVIDNGLEYYCCESCLYDNYTEKEWDELYDNGNSDSYYTEWN